MALNILLTNDDGFDAPGISSLFEALEAAGHTVRIVAPQDQQSAQGSTLGGIEGVTSSFRIEEFAPGNHFVDSTPVAAVLTGLALADQGVIFPDEEIDIVISGTNSGENIGPSPNISGTVNAAVAAIHRDLPAIAVSAGDDTDLAFARSADFVVDVLDRLEAQQPEGAPVLPVGTGLSINVPEAETPGGVAMTIIDREASQTFPIVEADEPLTFTSDRILPEGSSGNAISEGAQFLLDRITVSAIDGNWFSSESDRQTLEQRLAGGFNDQQDADRPLDIMLVNDDGVDAEGLEAVRDALLEAGHSVTVIAPLTDQSFVGTALTLGTWTAQEFEPGPFAVDAKPNTVVSTGIEQLLAEDRPDLVVSGANPGPSTGITATTSATLAAAVQSVFDDGIPAIAVSTGVDPAGQVPDGLFDFSGAFVAELIDRLLETAPEDGGILPADRGLNVNIPVGAGIDDIAFTELDRATASEIAVERVPVPGNSDIFRYDFPGAVVTDDPHSEGTHFLDGSITITPIDGNYTADLATTLAVADLLGLTFGDPAMTGPDRAAIEADMLLAA